VHLGIIPHNRTKPYQAWEIGERQTTKLPNLEKGHGPAQSTLHYSYGWRYMFFLYDTADEAKHITVYQSANSTDS